MEATKFILQRLDRGLWDGTGTKYGTVKQLSLSQSCSPVSRSLHILSGKLTVLSPTQGTRGGYSLEKVKQNVSGLGDTRQSSGLKLIIHVLLNAGLNTEAPSPSLTYPRILEAREPSTELSFCKCGQY